MWIRLKHLFSTQPEQPVVTFDQTSVHVVIGKRVHADFAWRDVVRIGYRTRDAWRDDHLVEFHLTGDERVPVSLEWGGAIALSDHVRALPDTRLTERGILSNRRESASVVVWPSSEAGQSLDEHDDAPHGPRTGDDALVTPRGDTR